MRNRIIRIVLAIVLLITTILVVSPTNAFANTESYVTTNIIFSNISGSSGGSVSSGPVYMNTITASGVIGHNGEYLIKLSDISSRLGLSTGVAGNNCYIFANGQTITFTKGNTYFTSSMSYTLTNPAGGTNTYSPSLYGYTDGYAVTIDGATYVPLEAALMQAGALFIVNVPSTHTEKVFDFRVNGTTPEYDSSKYVVGGKWLSNWSYNGATNVAPHFKRNELWYSGQYSSGFYGTHLKISTAMLQAEENVRYHYNNQSSINVTSGFRTWVDNITTQDAWARSMHSRGRAIDATSGWSTTNLYNNVYNEFKGTYPTPVSYGDMWRSRVVGTPADKSKAYAIEDMPQDNGIWLHLEVEPKSENVY